MNAKDAAHAIEAALAVARVPDYHGQIPLHYAALTRCCAVLLNLAPEVAREIEVDASTTEPRIHAMVLLARANYPPSRPWSTATAHVLRGIAAARPELTLIGEHMSRVRAFLLVARRLGIHSELKLRIIGWLYHADLFV